GYCTSTSTTPWERPTTLARHVRRSTASESERPLPRGVPRKAGYPRRAWDTDRSAPRQRRLSDQMYATPNARRTRLGCAVWAAIWTAGVAVLSTLAALL